MELVVFVPHDLSRNAPPQQKKILNVAPQQKKETGVVGLPKLGVTIAGNTKVNFICFIKGDRGVDRDYFQ